MTSTSLLETSCHKMDTKRDYFEVYTALSNWFTRYPRLITVLRLFNRLVVAVMYLAYLVTLVGIIWWHRASVSSALVAVAPSVLVPGIGFGLLTWGRHHLNAPRPYDEWEIEPLIPREKHGESLPSRHVFSATVISLVVWHVAWPAGIVLMALTFLLALARVFGGVHYPRDVFAGLLCGLICGAILWLF